LSVTHYRAIHRHLFQDVYRWAGRFRTVRIIKGDSAFCYPENIASEMCRLFRWLKDEAFLRGCASDVFAPRAAHFLAELNAVHPFRDGNGRAQLAFLALLSARAGHPLALTELEPAAFLDAMIVSFHDDEVPLSRQIRSMLRA
jgi:cell filamentation protein